MRVWVGTMYVYECCMVFRCTYQSCLWKVSMSRVGLGDLVLASVLASTLAAAQWLYDDKITGVGGGREERVAL